MCHELIEMVGSPKILVRMEVGWGGGHLKMFLNP